MCRNLALDKTRKLANQSQPLDDAPGGAEPADHSYSSNPERQAMLHDRVQLVRRLVDGLPEKQRSVMQLRDFEGKSYKEIATVMGVTEEQVKVNLFRARQTIKKKYFETENYGL